MFRWLSELILFYLICFILSCYLPELFALFYSDVLSSPME